MSSSQRYIYFLNSFYSYHYLNPRQENYVSILTDGSIGKECCFFLYLSWRSTSTKNLVPWAIILEKPICINFVFSDLSKTKVEASDLSLLQNDNVWCLKPDYIAEYLMQEPPPPPQKYLLPEMAKLAEPDRPVSSQSRKRKGEDDISGGKRARVWQTELTEDVCLSRSWNNKENGIFWLI